MDYFLKSQRLGFRCWHSDDLPLAMKLWGDRKVSALLGGPFTPDQVRERLQLEIERMENHGIQYWPLFLLDGDCFAGCAGLRPWGDEPRVYELGFHLRRDFWGQGLATEAAQAVTEYAFGALSAEALMAGHHPSNRASRKVLLKLGFVYVGMQLYPPTGVVEPIYRFGPRQTEAQ
jgi:RimJ/RimL family protein N-acetyltransferase